MIDKKNSKLCSDHRIHIENINECSEDSVICITVKAEDDSTSGASKNNHIFEVQKNGEIFFSGTDIDITPIQNPKDIFEIFEKIPEDISKAEIVKITEFINLKLLTETNCSKIYPYNVKTTHEGDIKILFVIRNSDKVPMGIPCIPIKLIDAHKSTVFAELLDLNAVISPGKIGIIPILVSKEKLIEKKPDLSQWEVEFSL